MSQEFLPFPKINAGVFASSCDLTTQLFKFHSSAVPQILRLIQHANNKHSIPNFFKNLILNFGSSVRVSIKVDNQNSI